MVSSESLHSIKDESKSSSDHPYLPPSRVSTIESWTDSVTRKTPDAVAYDRKSFSRAKTSPADPVVQAYLRLKLALLTRRTGQNDFDPNARG